MEKNNSRRKKKLLDILKIWKDTHVLISNLNIKKNFNRIYRYFYTLYTLYIYS